MTRNPLVIMVASVIVGIGLVPTLVVTSASAVANPVVSDVQITGDLTPSLVKDDHSTVTVQARIVCDTAVACVQWTEDDQLYSAPYLEVKTLTTGAPPPLPRWVSYDDNGSGRLAHFRRVSGTASDGIYRATLVFSPLQNGSYRIEAIWQNGARLLSLSSMSTADRTITVDGRDPVIVRPHIVPGAVKPNTSGSTTLSYLVQTRDSGHARSGKFVRICVPDSCGDLGYYIAYRTVTTATDGFTPAVTGYGFQKHGADLAVYVQTLNVDGIDELMVMDDAAVFPTTQSSPSKTWANVGASAATVTLGQTLTLSGSVGGNGNPTRPDTAIVQRWVGGQWSTLGRSVLLVNGRYSYVTKPQATGTNQYRVIKPTNACSTVCMSPQAVSPTLKVKVG